MDNAQSYDSYMKIIVELLQRMHFYFHLFLFYIKSCFFYNITVTFLNFQNLPLLTVKWIVRLEALTMLTFEITDFSFWGAYVPYCMVSHPKILMMIL
jgi:hypothetical protein